MAKFNFESKINLTALLFLSFFSLSALAENMVPVSKVTENDLGQVSVSGTESGVFEVDVPTNAFSLFVQVEGQKNLKYYIEKAENPKGQIILGKLREEINASDDELARNPQLTLRLSENPSLGPVMPEGFAYMVPNRENVQLIPGRWKFSLRVDGESTPQHQVQVRSFIKDIDGKVDQKVFGVVDVNLYFSGAGNWTSANYSSDPYFIIFRKSLQNALGGVGLTLNIRHVEDISFPKAIRVNSSADLNANLVKDAPVKSRPGIDLFFTSLLKTDILAVSFGLPGILPRGNARSGSIVSLPRDDMMSGLTPDTLGIILNNVGFVTAHEIGHYLGLMHVCERGSNIADDGLADTECKIHSNIMMPGAAQAGFSPEQRMILFRNPAVQLYRAK